MQHFDEASDGLYRKDLPLLGQDEIQRANNLREINYLGVDTYAPSIEDTKRKLIQYYGDK